ncbi:MAG: EF-hand domain-containing protein [Caulobacter sp.]|nr:EF-hand domain-containing protein [Caulobacter sp.]
MIRRLTLASALVLISASAALAQGRPPSADANNDGFVSKAEHLAASAQRFKRMDANSDGVIDKAEQDRVAAFMGGRNPLAAADANRDGKVTRDEFNAAAARRFAGADANKDGKLDAAEQAAMRPQRR